MRLRKARAFAARKARAPRGTQCPRESRDAVPARLARRNARANRGTRVVRRGRRLRRPGNGSPPPPHARRAVAFGRAECWLSAGGWSFLDGPCASPGLAPRRWSASSIRARRCLVRARARRWARVARRGGGGSATGQCSAAAPPPHDPLVVFDAALSAPHLDGRRDGDGCCDDDGRRDGDGIRASTGVARPMGAATAIAPRFDGHRDGDGRRDDEARRDGDGRRDGDRAVLRWASRGRRAPRRRGAS